MPDAPKEIEFSVSCDRCHWSYGVRAPVSFEMDWDDQYRALGKVALIELINHAELHGLTIKDR